MYLYPRIRDLREDHDLSKNMLLRCSEQHSNTIPNMNGGFGRSLCIAL